MKAPKWWDDGRAPYAPNNPFLNVHMIWIAGITPFVVGLPICFLYQLLVWLCH